MRAIARGESSAGGRDGKARPRAAWEGRAPRRRRRYSSRVRPTSRPRVLSLAPAVSLALGLVVLAPAARAEDAEAAGPRIRGELSAGAYRLDYAEYAPDGTFLDGEEGWMPSLSGALELGGRRGFFRASAQLASWTVGYDGHVQSTDPVLGPQVNGLPVKTTSDALFGLFRLEAGGFVEPTGRLALVGGFAARTWHRDIRSTYVVPRGGGAPVPVSGLSEVYTWYELQAGLRWTVVRAGRSELELEGAIFRTMWGTMEVDLGTKVALDLGDRTGFRGGGTYRFALGGPVHLLVRAGAESYHFGQSPVVLLDPANPASGIIEPRSDTTTVSLEAGVGMRF